MSETGKITQPLFFSAARLLAAIKTAKRSRSKESKCDRVARLSTRP
jgi:hypothetical protein